MSVLTAIISITHQEDPLEILSDLLVKWITHHCSLFESYDSKKRIIGEDVRLPSQVRKVWFLGFNWSSQSFLEV